MKNKIFLEELPRYKEGRSKNRINWTNSINYTINGVYNDIEFKTRIINYDIVTQKLTIKYNDEEFKILTGSFSKCQMGKILGVHTSEFKIEIDTIFKDDRRDIIITDREYRKDKDNINRKYYKYTCNICNWTEGWVIESQLLGKREIKCACCNGKIAILGINTIWDTDRWMCELGVSEEDAKTHTYGSHNKVQVICPDCNRGKYISLDKIYQRHSISCSCSDNIPFGEKLIFNIFEQLDIEFIMQLNKTTFEWCKNYRYDFYFVYKGEPCICEVNGRQHYEDVWDKLEKTQLNDKSKQELALDNGIKPENYIIIDCRKSELNWIKEHILKDNILNKLFDLSKIDWLKVLKFILSNKVKEACEHKRNNPNLTTNDIGEIMNYHYSTINRWLKQGNKFGWCNYNPKEEKVKVGKFIGKINCKPIICIETNQVFESATDCARKSFEIFGTHFDNGNISKVCNGQKNNVEGYTFKYI